MTDTLPSVPGEFLLYETEDSRTRVECRFVDDSLWLSQAGMADLFQVNVPTVNEHLKKLYAEQEIRPEATIRQYLMVRQEGRRQVNRHIDHYKCNTKPLQRSAGRCCRRKAPRLMCVPWKRLPRRCPSLARSSQPLSFTITSAHRRRS